MRIVHLMASPFFGGPERQVLGLARQLPSRFESVFLTFAEGGRCAALLDQVRRHGFDGFALEHNAPRMRRAVREVARRLQEFDADVLCCSGYKPDILGWRAARKVGIPVVSISHGWTAATWKVRLNEMVDRLVIRWMDAVVCVSEAQAAKVRRAGVREERIAVIPNAVGEEAFAPPVAEYAARLRGLFARPPRFIVGAAGRLSPEKGFGHLVEAAAEVVRRGVDAGFVVFGDGPLRHQLTQCIVALGLSERFVLAGFHEDVGRFLPHLDLAVLPSLTEGLPVVVLEALAAGVPVVATAVGGVPEVVDEGVSGTLVAAADAPALADAIAEMFRPEVDRAVLGAAGQRRVQRDFSFAQQSVRYQELFDRIVLAGATSAPAQRAPRDLADRSAEPQAAGRSVI
jgi:glycosyltransferase involved in cell wall biosynthesis